MLPKLAGNRSIQGLGFGDGAISEDDLPGLGAGPPRLALMSKQFTGECFKEWHPVAMLLSLSGSGVTDSSIVHLLNLRSCRYLDLSNTAITDASLRTLVRTSINVLDLRQTPITADGLMATPFSEQTTLRVAVGQYTASELRRLRQKLRIVVGRPEFEW
jgi:hypothetical protein